MGILVNSNQENVNVSIMYIEEKKPHGNVRFHFIRSEEELKEWKEKGYKLETELSQPSAMPAQAGMPMQVKRDENKIIRVLLTIWRRMSWKDSNGVYSKCLKQVTDGQGKNHTELDGVLYRDLKLKACLKKWNIKADSGDDVPVTPENIDMLVPEVALEMLDTFEKITEEEGS